MEDDTGVKAEPESTELSGGSMVEVVAATGAARVWKTGDLVLAMMGDLECM